MSVTLPYDRKLMGDGEATGTQDSSGRGDRLACVTRGSVQKPLLLQAQLSACHCPKGEAGKITCSSRPAPVTTASARGDPDLLAHLTLCKQS